MLIPGPLIKFFWWIVIFFIEHAKLHGSMAQQAPSWFFCQCCTAPTALRHWSCERGRQWLNCSPVNCHLFNENFWFSFLVHQHRCKNCVAELCSALNSAAHLVPECACGTSFCKSRKKMKRATASHERLGAMAVSSRQHCHCFRRATSWSHHDDDASSLCDHNAIAGGCDSGDREGSRHGDHIMMMWSRWCDHDAPGGGGSDRIRRGTGHEGRGFGREWEQLGGAWHCDTHHDITTSWCHHMWHHDIVTSWHPWCHDVMTSWHSDGATTSRWDMVVEEEVAGWRQWSHRAGGGGGSGCGGGGEDGRQEKEVGKRQQVERGAGDGGGGGGGGGGRGGGGRQWQWQMWWRGRWQMGRCGGGRWRREEMEEAEDTRQRTRDGGGDRSGGGGAGGGEAFGLLLFFYIGDAVGRWGGFWTCVFLTCIFLQNVMALFAARSGSILTEWSTCSTSQSFDKNRKSQMIDFCSNRKFLKLRNCPKCPTLPKMTCTTMNREKSTKSTPKTDSKIKHQNHNRNWTHDRTKIGSLRTYQIKGGKDPFKMPTKNRTPAPKNRNAERNQ